PDFKKVYRFYNRETGKAEADYICLHEETVDDSRPLLICDPLARWKSKLMQSFRAEELLVPIFRGGELVYDLPTLPEIKKYCAGQLDTLWPEVMRFDNPHQYYVDLSEQLMALKDEMLNQAGRRALGMKG
ncbi:MAG: nicotinate phosphoribosyltransferase, partial [Lachnospiraceae bacterium]|nr:nicotinate phosphoribosyltransferase [Lachnospiraceae bacterium]